MSSKRRRRVSAPVQKSRHASKGLLIDLSALETRGKWIVGTPPAIPKSSSAYSKWVQIGYTNTTSKVTEKSKLHSHRRSDEYYLVIRGTLRIRVEDRTYSLGPMHVLRVPERVPHMALDYTVPLTYFVMRTPSALPSEKDVVED